MSETAGNRHDEDVRKHIREHMESEDSILTCTLHWPWEVRIVGVVLLTKSSNILSRNKDDVPRPEKGEI